MGICEDGQAGERVLGALNVRLEAVAKDCNSQNVSNSLWSYATMGRRNSLPILAYDHRGSGCWRLSRREAGGGGEGVQSAGHVNLVAGVCGDGQEAGGAGAGCAGREDGGSGEEL